MKRLLLYIFLILLITSCEEQKYGEISEVKFEVMSNDNFTFTYSNKELNIVAAKPGSIKLVALNSNVVMINDIKLNKESINYHDSRFTQNHSVYEDNCLKITTAESLNNSLPQELNKGDILITVKENIEKSTYNINLSGSINMQGKITVNIIP